MNLHTLSYTRQVSRSIGANEERMSIFKGSSLTRKRYENKAPKKNQEADFVRVSADGEQPAFVDLLTGETIESEDLLPSRMADRITTTRKRTVTAVDRTGAIIKQYKRPHKLSQRSKNKIREKIFALYDSAGSDFIFLTLTFVAVVEDPTAQKCLNKFLTVLRKEFGRFVYLWVAERQENGNIHFHFICNRKFPIKRINSLWVLQQFNAGIVHEKYNRRDQIEFLHQSGTMGFCLNPVDVREVQNIEGLSGYLTGYITKNDAEFSCLAWHCNRYVSESFTGQCVGEHVVEKVKDTAINFAISRKGKTYVAKTTTVISKDTGKTLAVITNIVNKSYFKIHLKFVRELNKLLLSDYLNKKQVTQTFLLDRNKFFEHYYQQVNLN